MKNIQYYIDRKDHVKYKNKLKIMLAVVSD